MNPSSPAWDAQSARALFARVQKALAAFLSPLPPPPWEGRKVVIYGAGNFGRNVAKALRQRNVVILGFLDRNGTGQTVMENLPAHAPSSGQAKHWLAENPVAIIAVHNPFTSVRDIAGLLNRVGVARIATPMEVYSYLGQELGWNFWLGTADHYKASPTRIDKAGSLWADAESERLFFETLLYRLEFDLEMASTISGAACQYSHPTVPRWNDPLCMVDGGAYNGDTLRGLLRHGYRFDSVYAFEPDLENVRQLRDSIAEVLPGVKSSIWPCGLSCKTDRLKFAEGGGTSSKFSETGSAQVPVVALDDVLHGQPVNFIKLDIEGAEADALQGAKGLIEKHRPGLAVCLYHLPHHLWDIPLWIAELNLGYRFYYRVHEHGTFETVLYALPE